MLAIEGGDPVREDLLPYTRHSLDEADVLAVSTVLRSGWLTTGPELVAFEEEFAAKVEADYAVAFSSGTAALHGAAHVTGLGPGSEAVVTPLSFVATANCVRYVGGEVVFADVQPDTLLLDPQGVERALSPKTRAVITVDYAGQPSHLPELSALCQRHGLVLIEDAAHSLGASLGGRAVGSLADLTVFSLHPAKHVAAGEGGMVTTRDEQIAARLRRFRNHGISATFRERRAQGTWEYEVAELGFNYRLSEIHAALGRSQLSRLGASVQRRTQLASAYGAALSAIPEVEVLPERPGAISSWHLYPIRLHLDQLRLGRRRVFEALRAENIGVNVHYVPIPQQPLYRDSSPRGEWTVAAREYERLLSLPLFPAMTDGDQQSVISAVGRVIAWARR